MGKLTDRTLLLSVEGACSPYSNYIRDHMRRNGLFYSPAATLLHLNRLCRDGLLERSKSTTGYYGYKWTITDAGRRALSEGDRHAD